MDSEYMKIVNTIKEIASTVISNGEPMEVIVGEVVSVSPLAIKIDPKLTVPEENIILTKIYCFEMMLFTNCFYNFAAVYRIH